MNPNSKKIKAINPGYLSSVCVNNDLTYALKLWKQMLKGNSNHPAGNIIQECYDRKFFEKPSLTRRKKLDTAKYNQGKEPQ